MEASLGAMTKVLPGNKVEIEIPEGSIGKDIEIIIMLPNKLRRRNKMF